MDIDLKELDVLIVEDEPFQRGMLRDFLVGKGHVVMEAESGEQALRLFENGAFDLLLLDLRMADMNGLEVLRRVKELNPETDALVITAYGTIETAVEAMKAGARDYITKPVDLEELALVIEQISQSRRLLKENAILREELRAKSGGTDRFLYKSRKMTEMVNLAGRVAPSHASVLIQGETGTGKELLAKLVHNLSPRNERAFVVVNCAAIPENLLESELFGHEKGAFTGAVHRRIGRFELADGGTLFLDEIGELPLLLQAKLLRFIQNREFQRVGSNRTLHADVRIVSATHQDLEARVREGTFREDLFYRINVVSIRIPPLRERREDIPMLIEYFTRRFSEQNNRKVSELTREARDTLLRYDYPGNVRELENILERAVVIARDSLITVDELPFNRFKPIIHDADAEKKGKLRSALDALERRLIEDALSEARYNQTQAARVLGLSERMLRYKLKKHGIR